MTENKGPFFLCGALRSGTTLTRIMLDHHPRISNYGESDFLFEYPIAETGGPDLEGFRRHLSEDRIFLKSGI